MNKSDFDFRKKIKRVFNIKGEMIPFLSDVSILTATPPERLEPGKMILINLPGNGTSLTDDDGNPQNEEKIRASALAGRDDFFSFINEMGQDDSVLRKYHVKMDRNNTQSIACYYTRKVNGLIEEYNETGKLHDSFRPFADLFDDLISKNGQKINVEEAVSNMSKVILRGHCFGTLVTSELEQFLHIKLKNLGYNENECVQILSAPTAIFSSSPVDIEKQPRYFKVVAYANCADKFIPTLKGVPNYKDLAGFSQAEVDSDEKQMRELQIRENYRLIVCSSLEIPTLEELKDYAQNVLDNPTEEEVGRFVQKFLKGHAFSLIRDIYKKTPFMKMLQKNVREMMSKKATTVALEHSLDYAKQEVEKIKSINHGSWRKHKKAIISAEHKCDRLEEAQTKQARRVR